MLLYILTAMTGRKSWINVFSNGAVLCKWIPSSQQIDVTNEKCFPVYDYLAEHNLPLLVHSGPEYSIPTSNESFIEFNNPKYLRPALDRGVTVIIAHCALPYFGALDTKYQDDMEEFYKLFEESKTKPWKLYADLSALLNHSVMHMSRISLPGSPRIDFFSAAIILSPHQNSAIRKGKILLNGSG